MNIDELLLIWFDYQGITFNKLEKIFTKIDKIEDVLDENKIKNAFFDEELLKMIKKLQGEDLNKFEEMIIEKFNKYDISVLTYWSDDYPNKLKSIDDPPVVLYMRGDVSLLGKKSISIIGTRKPTAYGKIVCENFTKELSSSGLVTVSGLAYGIDTIVAQKTLDIGGKTIAVLAGGLDEIYPSQNTSLANKIVENGGLLITEYHIGVKPASFQFISRNRIVSALSLGTVIVEAGKSSGTMTTANFALEQSRELFVVPGNITSPQSEGTNSLINQMPDTFTISPDRILFKLGIKKQSTPKSEKQVDMVESKILSLLEEGEKTFDELCDGAGISASVLSSKLIMMEMFGLVKKGNANTYYKV